MTEPRITPPANAPAPYHPLPPLHPYLLASLVAEMASEMPIKTTMIIAILFFFIEATFSLLSQICDC